MRISMPGLGGRLRRARNATGLSQEKVAERIGVSWMTVHRWERSHRAISDHLLDKLCELYNKSIRWFLTLEEGDLDESDGSQHATAEGVSKAVDSLDELMAKVPTRHRDFAEKTVRGILVDLCKIP